MASISTLYEEVQDVTRLAEKASEANWDSTGDLGKQAERLVQIADIAARAAKTAAAVNKALI